MLLLAWSALHPGPADAQRYFISNGKKILTDTFDAGVTKMMTDIGIPAMSLAVIENNQVVYCRNYGYRSIVKKDNVDSATIFEAASLSKSYLVYTVFKLVEEGKLDLDKPMYQYMPYDLLEHDPRYKRITPRMILCHSSGIENWMSYNIPDTLEILSDPGTKYVYSGEAYNYLAKVVALLLHKSYEEYTKEIVLDPLGLKNSYVEFREMPAGSSHPYLPWDYATGHDILEKESGKWLNTDAVPSSANNVTAEDYARLIIATFDHRHLSDKSIQTILSGRTVTRRNDDGTAYYFGCGFEVIFSGDDTIISHGGSNPGFKNMIFYSVKSKRGFVYLTNSDRGRMVASRLSAMSADLNLHRYFADFGDEQYPSLSNDLLSVYRKQDTLAMYAAIEKCREEGKLTAKVLDDLGEELMHYNLPVGKRVLEESQRLFPDSNRIYWLLGAVSMYMDDYDKAYAYYLKARDMKFNADQIADDLKKSSAKMKEAARRRALIARIGPDEKDTVQAENYYAQHGIVVESTTDTGGGLSLGYLDPGDWINYRLHVTVPGTYRIGFRVASMIGGDLMELRSGDTILKTVPVPVTAGWQNYITLYTNLALPSGDQMLRIFVKSGHFNINWMEFSRVPDSVKN
jgi:CubicO group peptidase (beta-lactamase class C family)